MGGCISYEDPDDKIIRQRNKQQAQELKEFQRQLRFQKCYSGLDSNGRVVSKENKKR
jgi:hypothetical protein